MHLTGWTAPFSETEYILKPAVPLVAVTFEHE